MMNIDKIICSMMGGEPVSAEERAALVTDVKARISAGERGDDLPVAMSALGCDYDAASAAVFSEDVTAAMCLVDAATLTKEQYLQLQSDLEVLELSIAQGKETDTTDSRIREIELLMEKSPWMLCPDEGCIRKTGS